MKLAAIDIGSNAARLLISDVIENENGQVDFTKVNLVRVPLRLGFDVFATRQISPERADNLMKTIKVYQLLIDIYGIKHLKACATSAMRDAENGPDILNRVKNETGIDIKIISGQDEASIVYENHIAENLDKTHSYLYIDVGGGSTELTFFSKGKMVFKESFNIGTIRILQNLISDEQWQEMKKFIKQETKGVEEVTAIGSGGNINKVFSLSKKKEGKPLPLEALKEYYKELSSFSLQERMHLYKMREDRADVIVPALQIYCSVMRWAKANEIYVPKIGLADGLIHTLYDEVKALQNAEMN